MKKIAFVIYSLTEGGSERNTINLAYNFNKNGYKTDIITFQNINSFTIDEKEKLKQIRIINLTSFKNVSVLLLPLIGVLVSIRFLYFLLVNKYDILISETQFYTYYLTIFFSKILRIKTILVVGNTISFFLKYHKLPFSRIHTALHIISLQNANKIICVSKGVKKDLEHFCSHISNNKIVIIYNGIDGNHVQRLSHGLIPKKISNFIDKTSYLISFGRLDSRKNVINLVEAFNQVRITIPTLKLLIAGKGNEKVNILRTINRLHLQDKIILTGFLSNPFPVISKAKLFLFTSYYEGFGLTLLEAMACGVPIVSVDCPHGPREILHTNEVTSSINKPFFADYGVLTPRFKPNDNVNHNIKIQKSLSKGVIQLLSNKILFNQYKKRGLHRVKYFSIDNMSSQYLSVIEGL